MILNDLFLISKNHTEDGIKDIATL